MKRRKAEKEKKRNSARIRLLVCRLKGHEIKKRQSMKLRTKNGPTSEVFNDWPLFCFTCSMVELQKYWRLASE